MAYEIVDRQSGKIVLRFVTPVKKYFQILDTVKS